MKLEIYNSREIKLRLYKFCKFITTKYGVGTRVLEDNGYFAIEIEGFKFIGRSLDNLKKDFHAFNLENFSDEIRLSLGFRFKQVEKR